MHDKLGTLPVSLKLAVSLFISVMGIGYLFAVTNIYVHNANADGKPGLSVEDIRRTYYGTGKGSLLEAKITRGSMAEYLKDELLRAQLVNWSRDGASREGYQEVEVIFRDNCIECHVDGGFMDRQPLDSYEQVSKVTRIDRGKPINALVQSSHAHLITMSLMFIALTVIFAFTGMSELLKRIFSALPFAAIVMDFGGQWATKEWPVFAYSVAAAGGVMGISFAVLALVPLYEMWVRPMLKGAARS